MNDKRLEFSIVFLLMWAAGTLGAWSRTRGRFQPEHILYGSLAAMICVLILVWIIK